MSRICLSLVVLVLAIAFVVIDSHHHHKDSGEVFGSSTPDRNGFRFVRGPCRQGIQYTNATRNETCYCFFRKGYFCVPSQASTNRTSTTASPISSTSSASNVTTIPTGSTVSPTPSG